MKNIIALASVAALAIWMARLAYGRGQDKKNLGRSRHLAKLGIACALSGIAIMVAKPFGGSAFQEFLMGSLGFLAIIAPVMLFSWFAGRSIQKSSPMPNGLSVLTHAGSSTVRYENGRRIR